MEMLPSNEIVQRDFRSLWDIEKDHIIKAMEVFEGNKRRAAEALGITIKTLYNRLHAYDLYEKYRSHKP